MSSLSTVNSHARAALLSGFPAGGASAPAVQHFVTTFSVGLITRCLGFVFAALGTFSGNKQPKGGHDAAPESEVAGKVRVSAGVFAVEALAFVLISWLLFGQHS